MPHDSLSRRLYYAYLGYMYFFTYETSRRRILGIRLRTLVFLLPLALLAWGWLRRTDWMLIVGTLLLAWLLITYWRAGSQGYYRFVPDMDQSLPPEGELAGLEENEHVDVLATGLFSVERREANVLLQPAEYWQVPLGDHAVMVKLGPERFLYQFFNATTLQSVRHGRLIHGPSPQRALAVTFLSSWGPEFATGPRFYLFDLPGEEPQKQRTVFLSFHNAVQERAVWHNIVLDARRARTG